MPARYQEEKCYPVKSTKDAVFMLLLKILDQAKDDKKYFDEDKPPIGFSNSRTDKKTGVFHKAHTLKEDPIKELKESDLYNEINKYYINKKRAEK